MAKSINYLSLLISLFLSGFLEASIEDLPREFYVKEKIFTFTTSFDISNNDKKLASVHRKIFSLLPEYHLTDDEGQLLAKAQMRFFSFWTLFDVSDQYGSPLGQVKERFSLFSESFDILSPDSQILTNATLNFWGTKWTLQDPEDGHTIAIISRSLFRIRNKWTVTIHDLDAFTYKKIHPHLFLTLLAFQADCEYLKRQQQKSDSKSFKMMNLNGDYPRFFDTVKGELELQRQLLKDVNPNEEDFEYIETALENETSLKDSASAEEIFYTLLNCFNYDTLSLAQKAALLKMLEERLRTAAPAG